MFLSTAAEHWKGWKMMDFLIEWRFVGVTLCNCIARLVLFLSVLFGGAIYIQRVQSCLRCSCTGSVSCHGNTPFMRQKSSVGFPEFLWAFLFKSGYLARQKGERTHLVNLRIRRHHVRQMPLLA